MLKKFIGFQLAKEFHLACRELKIARYLQDQLLRASSSEALNLAEGSGKRTAQDKRRYYRIALGSLRECEAILELENISNTKLLKIQDQLGAVIYTLCKAMDQPKKPETNPWTHPDPDTETAPECPKKKQTKELSPKAKD